jgi:hypothetical protein
MAVTGHPMPPNRKTSREIPSWVSSLILLLVLVAGAWGIWRYFEGDSATLHASAAESLTDTNVDGPALPRMYGGRPRRPPNGWPNRGGLAAMIASNMPDGIMPTRNGFLVKSGTARLDVERANGNNNRDQLRYRFSYATGDLAPADEMEALRIGRRAMNDPAAAKLGVTQQQIQQLRNLPMGAGMVVEASDRARIGVLFHEWLAASGLANSGPSTRPTAIPSSNCLRRWARSATASLTPRRRLLPPALSRFALFLVMGFYKN